MSLTLNATLETAQSSQSRHPLVEIIASNAVADIPFDGQYLHPSEPANETQPNIIMHSSGRLCIVYASDESNDRLKYVYTDTDRTIFSDPIDLKTGTISDVSLCELANGDIGIVYILDTATWDLRNMVISPTGAIVTADASIESFVKATYTIRNPFVVRLADDSFLMVYVKKTIAGATYAIRKRTATAGNFGTWAAEAAVSVAGLTATLPIYSPSLLQISTGDIWLWFEYVNSVGVNGEEMNNIYYSTSSDNGATWAAATKETNYLTYGEVGKHPIAVQKIADQMHMIYYEQMGALRIDKDTTGWDVNWSGINNLTFDKTNRKIYTVTGQGGNQAQITKIDMDTWSIDKCWTTSSVPALLGFYDIVGYLPTHRFHCDDGYFIPIGIIGNTTYPVVSILNGEAETITDYIFRDIPGYGLTTNVNMPADFLAAERICHVAVNFDQKRLYILFGYDGNRSFRHGWIDLNEVAENYTWNEILSETYAVPANCYGAFSTVNPDVGDWVILPNESYIMLSGGSSSSFYGRLRVYDIGCGKIHMGIK